MDNTLIVNDILGDIKTVAELDNFLAEIENVLAGLFKVRNRNIDQILDKTAGKSTADKIKRLIAQDKINPTDYDSLEKLLTTLKETLKKIKTLKISLAIDPPGKMVEHFFDWVKENIGQGIILDIDKDETILGGAIITFNGIYKDFSLRRSLEEIFKSKKAEIMNFTKS